MAELDAIIRDLHSLYAEFQDKQYEAAIALGNMLLDQKNGPADRRRIVAELEKALDPSSHGALTRAHAAEALGKSGDRSAVASLIGVVNRDNYRLTRGYAARTLGSLGRLDDPGLIDCLVAALKNDEFFGVRAEAARSLGILINVEAANKKQEMMKEKAVGALKQYKADEARRLGRNLENERRVLFEVDRSLQSVQALVEEAEELFRRTGDSKGIDDTKRLRDRINKFIEDEKEEKE